MSDSKPVVPFSADDLKRRRRRALVMALCLAGLIILFYVSTLVKIAKMGAMQ